MPEAGVADRTGIPVGNRVPLPGGGEDTEEKQGCFLPVRNRETTIFRK